MKKISNFIVEKRGWIITVVLILTVICGLLIPQVNVNDDMTKYLPDDSSMKIGMDIMDESFPEAETDNTIRVMFTALDSEQKLKMKKKLSEIKYVSDVDYDEESEDYNKDKYTKYVLHMKYDYGSSEEEAITQTLEKDYFYHNMTYMDDSGNSPGLPLWVMVFSVALLMVILLIMSGSWFEPILFLFTISVAVVINLGTNLILGTISENTFSVTAILQLVLSMDYSIILINRYRQELENNSDKKEAMKAAITGAFSSISSSSFTTVVGLLALVFMSFKIGFDMGVVLAKGVFCSVVCVFLILPGLILLFSKAIEKTAKPVPHIPTGGLAKFCSKAKIPLTLCFIALFAGAYVLHNQTVICFSMSSPDIIADIFPTKSTVVMLYENKDDEKVTKIAEKLEERDDVKSAANYSNTLGKQYNSADMVDAIDDLSENMDNNSEREFDLDASLFNMMYYKYYGSETGKITASDFMRFITDDVITNETFSDYMGDDISEYSNMINKLSDAQLMKKPMDAAELADFFEMEKSDCEQLILYYFIQNGGASIKNLTITQFVDFVLNDLAKDKDYADMFDKETLEQMKLLKNFTNENLLKKEYTPQEIAEKLGFDEETARMLFVYYYGKNGGYVPKDMTIKELTDFLKNDVAKNKNFSSYFSGDTLSQIEQLSAYTDTDAINEKKDAAGLAQMLNMEESMVKQIFRLDARDLDLDDKTMTLQEFVGFLETMMNEPAYKENFDESLVEKVGQMKQIIELSVSDRTLSAPELSGILGIDEGFVSQLFMGYSAQAGTEINSMPLRGFIDFLINNILPNPDYAQGFNEETTSQLYMMKQLCDTAANDVSLGINDFSQMFGMEESKTKLLFTLYFGNDNKEMSLYDFVDYMINHVVNDPMFSEKINSESAQKMELLKQIMDIASDNSGLSYNYAASLFNMDASSMKQLYVLKDSKTADWKMNLQTLAEFLASSKNELSAMADTAMLDKIDMLKTIMDSALAKEILDAGRLSELTGMESDKANQLMLLYTYKKGKTDNWKLSVQKFIDFLVSDVLSNNDFADRFDEETSDKLTSTSKIVNAVIFGKKFDSHEMTELFDGMSDDLDENTISLLYFYHDANLEPDSGYTMSIEELMNYLADTLIYDDTFKTVIDDEMKEDIKQSAIDLNDGIKQLKSDNYSRLILSVTVPEEGEETDDFYREINEMCNDLDGEYHLIGSSAMNYEMSRTFDKELLTITILTAVAIFLVVLVTFRSIAVPAILVLLVQCGVYITVSVIGIQGYSIHYLALLIVQCILMGSTIDYAILFSTYYREKRKTYKPADALKEAFTGSMHTILTSGLIMVTITGILGQCFGDPTVEQICRTISIGAASAIFLIIFILPGILSCLDNFTAGKERIKE